MSSHVVPTRRSIVTIPYLNSIQYDTTDIKFDTNSDFTYVDAPRWGLFLKKRAARNTKLLFVHVNIKKYLLHVAIAIFMGVIDHGFQDDGSFYSNITLEISKKEITLDCDPVENPEMVSLFHVIGQNPALESLKVITAHFDPDTSFDELNGNLQSIQFQYCNGFDDALLARLAATMLNWPHLVDIDIVGNEEITSEGFHELSAMLYRHPNRANIILDVRACPGFDDVCLTMGGFRGLGSIYIFTSPTGAASISRLRRLIIRMLAERSIPRLRVAPVSRIPPELIKKLYGFLNF